MLFRRLGVDVNRRGTSEDVDEHEEERQKASHLPESNRSAWLMVFLPKMRKGGLVFMDDIHLGDTMERAWEEVEFQKRDISELHFTGFGVFEVP